MKKLLLIFTLLFSTLMFSTPSYGGWTKVSTHVKEGHTFYVDFKRIRKHDGYVYFWSLINYSKPSPMGSFSAKIYRQGDCKLFRHKRLSSSYHPKPMGGGTYDTLSNVPDKNWDYPPPNSPDEIMLKRICNQS
jgi:hypothetical protein